MAQGTRLTAVAESEAPEAATPTARQSSIADDAGLKMLLMGLRSLSQRSLVAIASLVDLMLLASAFVLWLKVIREPSPVQLVGIGGYALFILVAIWLRNRRA